MISVHPYQCKTWSEAKREWGWLMRSRGLQQMNRKAPTGYGEAPDLLNGKVEGPGFVIYGSGYNPRETTHTITTGAAIYGNRYCGHLNPF